METVTMTRTEAVEKVAELEYEMHLLFQGLVSGAFGLFAANEGQDDANSIMTAIENELMQARKAIK